LAVEDSSSDSDAGLAAKRPGARYQGGTGDKRTPIINSIMGPEEVDSTISSTTRPGCQNRKDESSNAGAGKPEEVIIAEATPGNIASEALHIPMDMAKEVTTIASTDLRMR
jgi:hypothetical protein